MLSIVLPAIRNARKPADKRGSLAETILADDIVADVEQSHEALHALPHPNDDAEASADSVTDSKETKS